MLLTHNIFIINRLQNKITEFKFTNMYTFFIVLILIAAALLVLAVLAQNPKGGMAANFGASNAVMGARQTADFLERFTWGLAISIVVLSLAATMAMPADKVIESNDALKGAKLEQTTDIEKGLPTLPSESADSTK